MGDFFFKIVYIFPFLLFVLKDLVTLRSKCFLLDCGLDLRVLKSSHCESMIVRVDHHISLLVFNFPW